LRSRINILAVAVVLAILSFAYARYDYANKHSATLTNPFGKHESTTVTDPFMDKALFGDWMKDEKVFAIVLPVALIAAGVVLAVRK
jgi:hypothetical protein